MNIRSDGQILKTKLVATMGIPRDGVFGPDGRQELQYASPEEFWNSFFGWFVKDDRFLIDIIRLNMAFFNTGENERRILKWLRDNCRTTRNVALLGDLPGPKLRIRDLPNDELNVGKGETLQVMWHTRPGGKPCLCLGDKAVGETDRSFRNAVDKYLRAHRAFKASIADSAVDLEVRSIGDEYLECAVEKDGSLLEGKGMTLRGVPLDLPSFQTRDQDCLDFLIDEGYDWSQDPTRLDSLGSYLAFIGVSFVKSGKDILTVKRYAYERILGILTQRFPRRSIDSLRSTAMSLSPSVIAKIETPQAWKNIDEILDVAEGAMVARGDLAEQIGPEMVPAVQKQIISLCNLRGKPVITATEMLASMETSPSPTRAEANDVYNAILDGSDAVMLSGETSKGAYPYQAVTMMGRIAETAELQYENFRKRRPISSAERRQLNDQRYHGRLVGGEDLYREMEDRLREAFMQIIKGRVSDEWLTELYRQKILKNGQQHITDHISVAACILSSSTDEYKAIVAPSASGRTVRMLSRFRPGVKLIGAAHDCVTRKKMIISYGVCPVNCGTIEESSGDEFTNTEQVFEACSKLAVLEGYLNVGDVVVYTAGTPLFKPGTTNLIQIKKVL